MSDLLKAAIIIYVKVLGFNYLGLRGLGLRVVHMRINSHVIKNSPKNELIITY